MGMVRQSTSRRLYLANRKFSTITDNTDTYDFAGGLIINDTTDYIEIYEIEIEDEPFDEFLGNIITYASEYDLFENLRENLIRMDLTKGADDQYYDYSPSQVEAILFGILQLTPEHQDIIVIDLKKHLKSFIQDKDQAEEMITQYTCYYNAIKRWESHHKETEILHQESQSVRMVIKYYPAKYTKSPTIYYLCPTKKY